MSVNLDLYTENHSIESPYLSRSFLEELFFDGYLQLDAFLTNKEINFITPKAFKAPKEERIKNPKKLKIILLKIENHLFLERDKLPLVHFLYEKKYDCDDLIHIQVNGVEASIDGDLHYYDNYLICRNKLHIKSYNEDYGKVDFFC